MEEQRQGGSAGSEGRITRRAALGSGIAALGAGMGVGVAWPAAGVASASTTRRMLRDLQTAIRGSGARPVVKRQLLSMLRQAGAEVAHGRALDGAQILREQFIPVVKHTGRRDGVTIKQTKAWTADAERLARALAREKTSPSAANGGRVTVFNNFNEPITGLAVSGAKVGDISSWSEGGSGRSPRYTPQSVTVPRSKTPQAGAFAIGTTPIRIPWDSFTGEATVRISSTDISFDDDLLLYLWTNLAALATTRGHVIDRFDVTLRPD